MHTRKLFFGLAASLGLATTGTAHAAFIQAGDLKIEFGFFNAGTSGYIGPNADGTGVVCTSVSDCDATAGSPTAGAFDGSEDSWGIFSISRITNTTLGGTTTFNSGDDGTYLLGTFYGLEDFFVRNTSDIGGNLETQVAALGGSLKIWETTSDWNANGAPGTSGRIDQDGFTGISDVGGNLWLEAQFDAGALASNNNPSLAAATYTTTFASSDLSGGGSAFLSVVGGSEADIFNTNGFTTFNGTQSDLRLILGFQPVDGADQTDWTVRGVGEVSAIAATSVPEPGTLALMGLALAGLGFSRRLRRS